MISLADLHVVGGRIEVHLSVVRELTAAQILYSSFGFIESGREVLSDGCTLIHMVKAIIYNELSRVA